MPREMLTHIHARLTQAQESVAGSSGSEERAPLTRRGRIRILGVPENSAQSPKRIIIETSGLSPSFERELRLALAGLEKTKSKIRLIEGSAGAKLSGGGTVYALTAQENAVSREAIDLIVKEFAQKFAGIGIELDAPAPGKEGTPTTTHTKTTRTASNEQTLAAAKERLQRMLNERAQRENQK